MCLKLKKLTLNTYLSNIDARSRRKAHFRAQAAVREHETAFEDISECSAPKFHLQQCVVIANSNFESFDRDWKFRFFKRMRW